MAGDIPKADAASPPLLLLRGLFQLIFPLVLGSWWTFLPVGSIALLLALRTSFEERMLLHRLDGYTEYTRRTRFRLVPGLW